MKEEKLEKSAYTAQKSPKALPIAIAGDSTFLIMDSCNDKKEKGLMVNVGFLEDYLPNDFEIDDNNIIVNENGAVIDAFMPRTDMYGQKYYDASSEEIIARYKAILPKGDFIIKRGMFPVSVFGKYLAENGLINDREVMYSTHVLYLTNYKKFLNKKKRRNKKLVKE